MDEVLNIRAPDVYLVAIRVFTPAHRKTGKRLANAAPDISTDRAFVSQGFGWYNAYYGDVYSPEGSPLKS